MSREIDLLANYPTTKRDIQERSENKTEEDRLIARQFGKEFFDGERRHGYGGYHYHPRFWQPVIPAFQKHYNLTQSSRILDVGCAKGFMLYDFMELIPGIHVEGVDISSYAIEHAHPKVKSSLQVANACSLPFPDRSFDLVISINTIHNLEGEELKQALHELQRVSRKDGFLVVDAYRTEEEKKRLDKWVLTAKTILSVSDWIRLFQNVGYTGDYYWFSL